ncbi:MAG: glycosyltransferase family 4 protein [Clostridiaceae bacterium]|nr:glycosyltransferase family 4 protein [Clostridiaceae bacterium]
MKTYNILICLNHLSYRAGGVSTHIIDLCKEYENISEIGKVVVACEWGERIDTLSLLKKTSYAKATFWSDGMSPKGILNSYRQLQKIVKEEGIDIVHVHSQRLLFAAHLLKVRNGIPYLWTNHIDDIPQSKLFKVMCRVMKFPVISVSQQLRRFMVEEYGCNPNRVFVVNNGTDLDKLTPLSVEEIKSLHEEYHIDTDKTPYIICELSRISPIKGQLKLLQAVNNLEEKSKVKILIAGSVDDQYKEYFDELENYAKDNSLNVEFLGFSEPRNVFGVSNLFVLPSIYEGFPLVCIEALAMGCAVIRTKTPGWQEMQEWVTCIDKDNEDALIEAIRGTINNSFNAEMTKAGQMAVKQLFTKEQCAQNTLAVYKKLVGV